MSAGDGATEYIEISDFSPGVLSAHASAATPFRVDPESQSSYARKTGTWGCYGHPAGGLHPLPKMVETVTVPRRDSPVIPWGLSNPNSIRIAATHCLSPVVDRDYPYGQADVAQPSGSPALHPTPDILTFVFQSRVSAWDDVNAKTIWTTWVQTVQKRMSVDNPANRTVILNDLFVDRVAQSAAGYPFTAANITRVTTGTLFDAVTNAYVGYSMPDASIAPGREPGRVGLVVNINAPFVQDPAGSMSRVFVWPRIMYRGTGEGIQDGMLSDTPYRWKPVLGAGGADDFTAYLALSHQNRYVWCKQWYRSAIGVGFLPGGAVSNLIGPTTQHASGDYWLYTPPNDLAGTGYNTGMDPSITPNPYYDKVPNRWGQATSGFGAAASMNASELYLVKQTGGGTIVRGNLDTPQVTDYPGVPSTNGATNIPTPTPLGLVYGTRDGVYAWSGADQTKHLSPQLDGWFWKPEDGSTDKFEYNAPYGKFAYLYPFVFAPNNWVLDTRSGGWFRLTDPTVAVYKDYNVSAAGHFYAHPGIVPYVTGGVEIANQPVGWRFDPTRGGGEYKWASQPLAITRNRSFSFGEINIVAEGAGTVTVTVNGLDGSTGSVTFTVDDPNPVAHYGRVNVTTHDVELSIHATGATADDPAPTLHRVSLGYNPGPSVAKTV